MEYTCKNCGTKIHKIDSLCTKCFNEFKDLDEVLALGKALLISIPTMKKILKRMKIDSRELAWVKSEIEIILERLETKYDRVKREIKS